MWPCEFVSQNPYVRLCRGYLDAVVFHPTEWSQIKAVSSSLFQSATHYLKDGGTDNLQITPVPVVATLLGSYAVQQMRAR